MNTWLQDVGFGIRILRKSPSFSVVAILVIALGIGANTAIFSVVEGVLLHGLSYEDPDRLVIVWSDATDRGGINRIPSTPGDFLDWSQKSDAFRDMAALSNFSLRLTDLDTPVVPLTHRVTHNYFDVIGVRPFLGRDFVAGEETPGQDRVVMISYGLWQRAFGGDPEIVNSDISLDFQNYTVIGVVPPEFYSAHLFAVQPDLWIPLDLSGQKENRRLRNLIVYGRLASDRTLEEAQGALSALAANLAQEYPDTNKDLKVRLEAIREDIVGSFRSTFLVLLVAVAFLLVVACANVANLQLTRAAERARELALRMALGAARWRVLRQILTESLILAGAGGTLGVALAWWGVGPMSRMIPSTARVPFVDEISVNATVLFFAVVVTLGSGILFGMAPALRAGRSDLNESLKEAARGGGSGSKSRFAHRALVVSQVSVSMLLLAGAGLIVQSFNGLTGYDPGYDAERILTLRNSLRGTEFDDPARRTAHFEELVDNLEALPGVESASAVNFPPPITRVLGRQFAIEGKSIDPGAEPSAAIRQVMPGYFATMGIPVLRGRTIGGEDRVDSQPVALVNQATVKAYFDGEDPIGRLISIDMDRGVKRQVVGVVGNVRARGMDPTPVPAVYTPHSQQPVAIMNLIVRVTGDPSALARVAERKAWEMAGSGNVYAIQSLQEVIDDLYWPNRLASQLLGAFALLALSLGAFGIYAVISSSVSGRVQEFGVRIALGASRGDIRRLVLKEGLQLTAFGVGLGLLASIGLTGLISSQLYGVSSTDPGTLGLTALILLSVAVAACLQPARKAVRVDPIESLQAK